jgi:hypothetical protein
MVRLMEYSYRKKRVSKRVNQYMQSSSVQFCLLIVSKVRQLTRLSGLGDWDPQQPFC